MSKEDKLIEAHSPERAVSPGQIGGSVTLDTNISIRSSDVGESDNIVRGVLSLLLYLSDFDLLVLFITVTVNEREAILHLLAWRKKFRMRLQNDEYHESPILGLYLREGDDNSIPTPLHEVGTWREPLDPTGTSKVRLLDSSIHVFAATFGLQDPHTQADALRMLEAMHVSAQTEKPNQFAALTKSSLIADSQGRVKVRRCGFLNWRANCLFISCSPCCFSR